MEIHPTAATKRKCADFGRNTIVMMLTTSQYSGISGGSIRKNSESSTRNKRGIAVLQKAEEHCFLGNWMILQKLHPT